jgi:hypothetical protein
MAYTCTGAGGASSLGTLASGIWLNSLGQPTSISALSISGYFAQDYVVGALNAKISTCYSGSNAGSGVNWAICPDLDDGSLNLIGLIYLSSYWTQKVASAAGAGGISDTFTVLREGDSTIQRTSPAELMKVYSSMLRQTNDQLNYAVAEYSQNSQGSRLGRSVDYVSILFPSTIYPGV